MSCSHILVLVPNGACYSGPGASGALSGPAFRMTFRVRVRFVTVDGVIIISCTKRWPG